MSDPSLAGGRQIRLFLVDGTPNGVMNWTGKGIAAPRLRLVDLVRRVEAEGTGIYILVGPDPERATGLDVSPLCTALRKLGRNPLLRR